ncbi:hypothetical protein RFI_17691, partial [Reticulomyxa filosa]
DPSGVWTNLPACHPLAPDSIKKQKVNGVCITILDVGTVGIALPTSSTRDGGGKSRSSKAKRKNSGKGSKKQAAKKPKQQRKKKSEEQNNDEEKNGDIIERDSEDAVPEAKVDTAVMNTSNSNSNGNGDGNGDGGSSSSSNLVIVVNEQSKEVEPTKAKAIEDTNVTNVTNATNVTDVANVANVANVTSEEKQECVPIENTTAATKTNDVASTNSNAAPKRGVKRSRKPSNAPIEEEATSPPSKRRRTTRNSKKAEKEDPLFKPSSQIKLNSSEDNNPLPDFIDIMTGEIARQPTLSPYGHVLGYETWCKILRNPAAKDTCPFTKQKLSRRSLIKLNKENIDLYRNSIRNFNDTEKIKRGKRKRKKKKKMNNTNKCGCFFFVCVCDHDFLFLQQITFSLYSFSHKKRYRVNFF